MNKKFLMTLAFLFTSVNFAYADNTTQLIIDKTLNPDRKTGFILSSELVPLQKMKVKSGTFYSSESTFKVSPNDLNMESKSYSILEDKHGYNSVIVVKNSSNQELKRISVAKKAKKIIKSEKNQHLFVLCEGYFGSVWQINPETNQVVRKFSTSWNPTDIAVSEDGKYLYVTSGKLQKFSLDSELLIETDIPSDFRYLESIQIKGDSISFSAIGKDSESSFLTLNNKSNKFEESSSKVMYNKSKEQSINLSSIMQTSPSNMMLVYSKNNDYIYLFSKKSNSIEGILPVDSKPDQIVISEKLNRAYVLHRVIGQISLIDLSPDSNTQYSVIARITDERLKDPSNVMIIEGTKVFVKSDVSQEGYIDSDNILRYTGPVVEIPLNKNKMIFEPSVISNKRFSLKSGQLFVESITEPSENFSRKIKLIQFGNNLGGLAMKKDGKFFYLSDYSQNKLLVVDSFSEKVVASANTGINPSSVMVDDKNIYVLNQGDNSISTFELDTLKLVKTTNLKIENNSLNMIKIYDRDFEQIIKVNLPPETKKELIIARLEN